MSSSSDRERGIQRAKEFRGRHPVARRIYPLARVADEQVWVIREASLSGGCDGACFIRPDHVVIEIQKSRHWPPKGASSGHPDDARERRLFSPRQRFTVAHEIGHITDPNRQLQEYRCDTSESGRRRRRTPKELECDSFAAELLMPESLFAVDMDGAGLEKIKVLADLYCTSLNATSRRFVELSRFDCIFIEYRLDLTVSDFYCSDQFRSRLDPNEWWTPTRPHVNSATQKVIRSIRDRRGPLGHKNVVTQTLPWRQLLGSRCPLAGYAKEEAIHIGEIPRVFAWIVPEAI